MYELLRIYYDKKDYKKALKICDKMIALQNDMYNLHWNKAAVYFSMGNKKEANKIIHFIEEQDVNKIKEILNLNNVASLEELNKKKRFFLAVPGF